MLEYRNQKITTRGPSRHMPSLSARLLKLELRLAKPLVRFTGIEQARTAQDQLGRMTARLLQDKVTFEPVSFPDFTACFAFSNACEGACDRTILYLHGGAYTAGGLDYAKGFGALLASETKLNVFCVAYRLAPEYKYPAALNDAYTAYRYLLERGYQPNQIAIAGESAGGGLALALALRLRDEGISLPAGIACISPWTDLTFSGASYRNNVYRDPSLIRESLAFSVIAYAAGYEYEPYVSPAFGDYTGFPPCLFFAGSDEILLSDAKNVHHRLLRAGVPSELVIENGMWHVYPLYGTPEGKRAIERMAAFLRVQLGLEAKPSSAVLPKPVPAN